MKYIIIGGVTGAAAAATRIRRNDENAQIIILEKDSNSYTNCALPYYIGDIITEKDKMLLHPQDSLNRYNIDIRQNNEVLKIDSTKKLLTIKNETGKDYSETYDKLLISADTIPLIPNVFKKDLEGVYSLRDISEADEIKNYIKAKNIQKVAIIGANFLGFQMTENLHKLGIHVSIIDKKENLNNELDYPMASLIYRNLLQNGIDLYLDKEVAEISKENDKLNIHFKDNNDDFTTDMILLSTGTIPDTEEIKKYAIKLGKLNGVEVNSYLQTSVSDIYTIGKVVEFKHPILGKPVLSLTENAIVRQAVIAADNMVFGNKFEYEGTIGTNITKVFNLVAATTGLNEKSLKETNIHSDCIYIHEQSHAACYPEAKPLSIKLFFNRDDGKILGGQIVGIDGVDKRIDQLSVLIKKNGTIDDLIKLEQAYAPQFSSPKDPLSLAGYAAKNVITGKMPIVQWYDIDRLDKGKTQIIDVRTKDEFEIGAIPNAINIPLDDLRNRLKEIPKDKPLYVYCVGGFRGYVAQQILLGNGFKDVHNLAGGIKTYNCAKYPLIQKGELQNSNDSKQKTYDAISSQPSLVITKKIDASGLQCPGPILKLKSEVDKLNTGEALEITATDSAFQSDVVAWTKTTGNTLLSNKVEGDNYVAVVRKGREANSENQSGLATSNADVAEHSSGKGKTIIMFSDDLDRAIANFVLANGAAATGQKVTLFFTFWGLNVIKKVKKPKVKKDFFGKMFSIMLPSSSLKLKLSKFNMCGLGSKMMRHIMKQQGISSVEELRQQALDNGVEFIACEMSMNAMGIKREELIDEITVGGVATYMGWADQANVNLFI